MRSKSNPTAVAEVVGEIIENMSEADKANKVVNNRFPKPTASAVGVHHELSNQFSLTRV